MVNHLRTLLLNERPDADAPLEEYIESDFVPLALRGAAAGFRNELIRTDWPRDFKNFLATQLTRIAYSSPYAVLLQGLDPRLTFDPAQSLGSIRDTISLTRYRNADALNAVGVYYPDPDAGVFSAEWEVAYESPAAVTVTDLRTRVSSSVGITFNGDSTGLHPIDGRSALFLQFVGVTEVPANLLARVKAIQRMPFDVLSMVERLQAHPRALEVLSPYPELARAFQNRSRPDQQLAVALIAFALEASK